MNAILARLALLPAIALAVVALSPATTLNEPRESPAKRERTGGTSTDAQSPPAYVFQGPQPEEPPTAASNVELHRPDLIYADIVADLEQQADPYRYRYLFCPSITPQQWLDLNAAVQFTYNSLSKNVNPLAAMPVGRTLWRVDLKLAGVDPKAWDSLGLHGSGPRRIDTKRDFPEPYFHELVVAAWDWKQEDVPAGYVHTDGKTYYSRWVKVPANKVALQHASWLNQADVKRLVKLAGTDFPVFRADWWIFNALLPPAYYDLLIGLNKRKLTDFYNVVKYRDGDLNRFRIGATVIDSKEVSQNNRTLLGGYSPFGYGYESFDYNTSVRQNALLTNVLRAVKKEKGFKFRDAGEEIYSLPNRLQAYAITDENDKLLDKGNTAIVVDRRTHWKYKEVYPGLSCVTCHEQGLKEVRDEIRFITDFRKSAPLLIYDPKDADAVADLFSKDFNAVVAKHQAIYADALREVNGLGPSQNAALIARIAIDYDQQPLTLDDAARELGFTSEHFRQALTLGLGIDGTLTDLLVGGVARRDQAEDIALGQAMLLCQDLERRLGKGEDYEELLRQHGLRVKEEAKKRKVK